MDVENQTDLNNVDLEELFTIYNANRNNISEKMQELDKLQNNKKVIQYWLYKKCSHHWEREDVYSGPYDKPDYVCTKCGLIKDEYLYRLD